MNELAGKVIWITGASSGIGESLTYALAKLPVKIIISSRRRSELERVKNNCEVNPEATINLLPLDLGNQTDLAGITAQAIEFYAGIDILINNAGISQRSLAADTALAVDRKIMEINYFGTIALTKYLLPSMVAKGGGHIVNVSSLVGKFGTPYRSAYAASKHALHGFFDALRAELWKKNIKVTMICPGFVKTKVSINALTGNGDPLNEMDNAQENGMHPDKCALKIIRAIVKEKQEVYIGGKETLAVYLKRWFPSIFSKLIRKAAVR